MSRRKVQIERTQKWASTITVCDLCKTETLPGEYWRTSDRTYSDSNEVTIEAKIGDRHPWDGGDERIYYRLDLCPKCFVEKFIPLVEKGLGVEFESGDVDE